MGCCEHCEKISVTILEMTADTLTTSIEKNHAETRIQIKKIAVGLDKQKPGCKANDSLLQCSEMVEKIVEKTEKAVTIALGKKKEFDPYADQLLFEVKEFANQTVRIFCTICLCITYPMMSTSQYPLSCTSLLRLLTTGRSRTQTPNRQRSESRGREVRQQFSPKVGPQQG